MSKRGDRFLIVNADDFGMSSGVNRGIVDAHRTGIVTSTSLMVNRPGSEDAAQLARQLEGLSVGLHLEFGSATPENPIRTVRDQLHRFEQLMGGAPTHLDSHHDAHRNSKILPAVLEVAHELGVPARGDSEVRCLTVFYGQWGGRPHLEQVSVEGLIGMLQAEVTTGVTELVCHPGYADPGLDSSYTRERDAEVETLRDPRVAEALGRMGIRLVGFRDLVKLPAGCPEGEASDL